MRVMIIALKGFDSWTTSIDPIVRDLRRRLPGKEVHGDSGKIFLMSMDLSEIPEAIVEEAVRAAGYEYEIESADGVQTSPLPASTISELQSLAKQLDSLDKQRKRPWWKFWG